MYELLSYILLIAVVLWLLFHVVSVIIYYIKNDVNKIDDYQSKESLIKKSKFLRVLQVVYILDLIALFIFFSKIEELVRPILNLHITFDNFYGFITSVVTTVKQVLSYSQLDFELYFTIFGICLIIFVIINLFYFINLIIQLFRREVISKYQLTSVISTLIIINGVIYLGTHINNLYEGFNELKDFISAVSNDLSNFLDIESIKSSVAYFELVVSTVNVLDIFITMLKSALIFKIVSGLFGLVELYNLDLKTIKFKRYNNGKDRTN